MADIKWPSTRATAEEVVSGMDLKGRYFVVTGANTGIGLETARVLAKQGGHVTMACRNMDKAKAAEESIRAETPEAELVVMKLDLADLSSVEAFAADFKASGRFLLSLPCLRLKEMGGVVCRPLNVLLLNAGLYAPPETHTTDGFETTFQVNHLSQWYLAQLLLDNLRASAPSRVIAVSSIAHMQAPMWGPEDFKSEELLSPSDVSGPLTPLRIYGFSKLCNILFAKEFQRRYGEEGVTAYCLHPGAINTEFGRNSLLVKIFINTLGWVVGVSIVRHDGDVWQPRGAATQTFLATTEGIETLAGHYFDGCRDWYTTGAAKNLESANNLWETSANMIAKWKEDKKL